MWISKKHYEYINKRIAELERQVKIQQLTLEMCKKVDTSAKELTIETQSFGDSLLSSGSIR